jgi:hypothetical protein
VQVVAHEAVVAAESEACFALPGAGFYGQRGDVKPGRPSFSPLDEFGDARAMGLDSCALQQRGCLLRGHRQIFGADLKDAALSAQARGRQRHIGARRQCQPPSGREA